MGGGGAWEQGPSAVASIFVGVGVVLWRCEATGRAVEA